MLKAMMVKEYTGEPVKDTPICSDVSEDTYEERFAYGVGFKEGMMLARKYLLDLGEEELAKAIVSNHNKHVISQDCFGLTPSGGDAYKG